MSRRTTMEFVGAQRRAYAQLKSKAKKTALINSMCQAFGFDRKYANKLLTGNRRYKDPKGRGKTYSDKAVELLTTIRGMSMRRSRTLSTMACSTAKNGAGAARRRSTRALSR